MQEKAYDVRRTVYSNLEFRVVNIAIYRVVHIAKMAMLTTLNLLPGSCDMGVISFVFLNPPAQAFFVPSSRRSDLWFQ